MSKAELKTEVARFIDALPEAGLEQLLEELGTWVDVRLSDFDFAAGRICTSDEVFGKHLPKCSS